MTQGTISLWKKGAIKTTPSQTALMSFANFMGITVDDLAVQIGITNRRTVNIAEIKSAIGQADLEEALALQDALIDRVKEITINLGRTRMQSIGEAIAQYMAATATTDLPQRSEMFNKERDRPTLQQFLKRVSHLKNISF